MRLELTERRLRVCDLGLFFVLLTELGIGEHVVEVRILDLGQIRERLVSGDSKDILVACSGVVMAWKNQSTEKKRTW